MQIADLPDKWRREAAELREESSWSPAAKMEEMAAELEAAIAESTLSAAEVRRLGKQLRCAPEVEPGSLADRVRGYLHERLG